MTSINIPKWIELLPLLDNNSLQEAKKVVDITDSHLYELVKLFDEKGWIRRHKINRYYIVALTRQGKEVALNCEELLSSIQ